MSINKHVLLNWWYYQIKIFQNFISGTYRFLHEVINVKEIPVNSYINTLRSQCCPRNFFPAELLNTSFLSQAAFRIVITPLLARLKRHFHLSCCLGVSSILPPLILDYSGFFLILFKKKKVALRIFFKTYYSTKADSNKIKITWIRRKQEKQSPGT